MIKLLEERSVEIVFLHTHCSQLSINQNSVQAAINLFSAISKSRWFSQSNFIIFFNKIDLFREKISRIPLSDYFPDYQGGSDFSAGTQYFRRRITSITHDLARSRTPVYYVHYTSAIESQHMKRAYPSWRSYMPL